MRLAVKGDGVCPDTRSLHDRGYRSATIERTEGVASLCKKCIRQSPLIPFLRLSHRPRRDPSCGKSYITWRQCWIEYAGVILAKTPTGIRIS